MDEASLFTEFMWLLPKIFTEISFDITELITLNRNFR